MSNPAEIYKTEINLIDFAKQEYGYKINLKKSTKRQVVMEDLSGETKIVISRNAQGQYWYFNPLNHQDKGTIIDFVLHRNNNDQENMWEELNFFLQHTETNSEGIESWTSKPNFTYEPLKDTQFLEKRGNSFQTIHAIEFKDRIFTHTYKSGGLSFKNTAFPIYQEEEIIGLELKNTNYHGYASGSRKNEGFWLSNLDHIQPHQNIEWVVAESALDCLSFHQLSPPQNQPRVYISLGGMITEGQLMVLQRRIDKHQLGGLILANDNDITGIRYNIELLGSLVLNPQSKHLFIRIFPLGSPKYRLDFMLHKEKEDLDIYIAFLRQVFFKIKEIEVEEIKKPDQFVANKISFIITASKTGLKKIAEILPKLRGIQSLVKVITPQKKDFNEDLMNSLS